VLGVPSASRAFDRGTQLGDRALKRLGREVDEARRGLSLSQDHLATAAGLSRPRYSKIERGKTGTLQVIEVARIASVLGLDPSFRVYPSGPPLRDAASALRRRTFVGLAAPPLRTRTEVPLPALTDRRDLRAWDAMLFGSGERTAIELEMPLRDAQAVERRMALKRRDDPTEHFILLIADTRTNRRILAEFDGLFELPRLLPTAVRAALASGRYAGTGIVLV
jgi:transcriptional regulator with XRE-family HTH domain